MKERPVMMNELDAIDYQIIHMLQKNARARCCSPPRRWRRGSTG